MIFFPVVQFVHLWPWFLSTATTVFPNGKKIWERKTEEGENNSQPLLLWIIESEKKAWMSQTAHRKGSWATLAAPNGGVGILKTSELRNLVTWFQWTSDDTASAVLLKKQWKKSKALYRTWLMYLYCPLYEEVVVPMYEVPVLVIVVFEMSKGN